MKCPLCREVIKVPGATILTPPPKNGKSTIYEICTECYENEFECLFGEKFSPIISEE